MKPLLTFLACTLCIVAQSQVDSVLKNISLSAYAEAYYCFDMQEPEEHTRPANIYSFNRHNEFAINIAMMKLNYDDGRSRANVGFMTGTYAIYNLMSEPQNLQHLYEANIGVRLGKKHDLWFDMGVMPSHIGFESAIGQDCWNLSRSLIADNTPYYESGARLSYTSVSKRWYLSALVLNGWQNMWRQEWHQTPAFGHQLTFKPSGKWLFNSSSFAGGIMTIRGNVMRYYHNFYCTYTPNDKWGFTANFDAGLQRDYYNREVYNNWWSWVAVARRQLTPSLYLAARAERISDPKQAQLWSQTQDGIQVNTYSANLDWKVSEKAMWRIEARHFGKEILRSESNTKLEANWVFTTSLSLKLE